ncbi:diacylglycerol/lipid kinase family protein [Cryobacterium roopkundense]|uniref:YegS/Rv2252/BmrU family lipid kinase n=1 Tax=Cryobacterium roopkundense TaxID=1001240 RepID=A0A7W9E3S7_9MICO|nr:diacylglycerol kinase family protein [Cryobacterium roopkundense]MBB5640225.1 YegS/Rv2252/BmrU family lipid kinase [Cryobacterium roopkundense]
MRSFHVLVNAAAGGSSTRQAGASVVRLLREAGADAVLSVTESAANACRLAAHAARLNAVIVAVGGDGTVGSLAGMVVREGGTLGLVPIGRGNDFARQLGVPSGVPEVVRVLLDGQVKPVDVIDVNGQIVVGSVYAGIDSLTSELVNRAHWLPSRLQYPFAAIRAIATHRSTRYWICVDGVDRVVEAHTVVVANSGYYGSGMHVAPTARADDGLLNVVIIGEAGRLRLLKALRMAYDGSHVTLDEVTEATGREITIASVGALAAYADGDRIGALPVTARMLAGPSRCSFPNAVRVGLGLPTCSSGGSSPPAGRHR